MRTEIMSINEMEYKIRIKIEKRNDSRVSISQKSINIRVPNFLSREELFQEVQKMKSWAKQKILENPEKFRQKLQKKYCDGQEISVGNEKYLLKIRYLNKTGSSARIDGNTIFLSISSNLNEIQKSKHISTLISRCLARKKLPEVRKRIEEFNAKYFNKEIKKVFFKYNQSNWGSCSERGNINLSTRLLFAPQEVFDYLCIHELAHLVEQNHSEQFWAMVEKAMPDYKEKEKWLKENGRGCTF